MWVSIGEYEGHELGDSSAWIAYCNEFAMSYIKTVLGEPPYKSELAIRWNEHEMGSYPTLGVSFTDTMEEPPWDYISKAENLLTVFNDAIAWSELRDAMVDAQHSDED